MSSHNATVFALDVGDRRVGVARASLAARLPAPFTTLLNTADIHDTLAKVLADEAAVAVVVGLPRGMQSQDTQQTQKAKDFALRLSQAIAIPLYYQDEAVTSAQAEAELNRYGKQYTKEDIDALAATYILEDFLREHQEIGGHVI